jgi:hypothetical protein
MSVTSGFPDYEGTDISPGANLETPIQGTGDYPGTSQDGIPQFGGALGTGVVGPGTGGGSMGPGGGDYPGTSQDGLAKYGTS